MSSLHKITLTKKEFQSYVRKGALRIEADFYVDDEVVKHCKAMLLFELKNDNNLIELTFGELNYEKNL